MRLGERSAPDIGCSSSRRLEVLELEVLVDLSPISGEELWLQTKLEKHSGINGGGEWSPRNTMKGTDVIQK